MGLGNQKRSPQSASCFGTGRVAKSGKILILDLKTTCMKKNKRMAVPRPVPSVIPALKRLILTQPLEVQTRNSLLSQLTARAVLPESLGHLEQNTTPEPSPSWGATGRGGRQPRSWTSEGGGDCRKPGAEVRGGQSCPRRHRSQGAMNVFAAPEEATPL